MRGSAEFALVREMTPADVAAIEAKARANYTYGPDPDGQDIWTDHADDVEAGQAWVGDCDDLAMTVLSLCVKAGLPKASAFRLFVFDVNGAGHMVGAVVCEDGTWLVVGDTWFNGSYPVQQMPHKGKDYNCMAEGGPGNAPVWRAGVPWLAGQPLAS